MESGLHCTCQDSLGQPKSCVFQQRTGLVREYLPLEMVNLMVSAVIGTHNVKSIHSLFVAINSCIRSKKLAFKTFRHVSWYWHHKFLQFCLGKCEILRLWCMRQWNWWPMIAVYGCRVPTHVLALQAPWRWVGGMGQILSQTHGCTMYGLKHQCCVAQMRPGWQTMHPQIQKARECDLWKGWLGSQSNLDMISHQMNHYND